MGSLSATPVPTVLARPVNDHVQHAAAEVSMSDAAVLQSMRDTRDRSRELATDLRAEQVEMSALNEEIRVDLRKSQERFAADFLLFQGGASTYDEARHRPHVVAEHEPLEMSAVRLGTAQVLSREENRDDVFMSDLPLCAICGDRTDR